MRTFAGAFAEGASAPWRGLSLLGRRPRLAGLALAPGAIAAVLFAAGVFWAVDHLHVFVQDFLLTLAAWSLGRQPWVYFAAMALAWPAFLGGLAFAAFLLARLFASPFSSFLAERALAQYGGASLELRSARDRGAWLWKMLLASLAQQAVLLAAGASFFVLSFLPIVNVLAAPGYFLAIAFDCVSYSQECQGLGIGARWTEFRARFAWYLGFAASIGLLLAVPGLNFFAYSFGVAGGAWLCAIWRAGAPGGSGEGSGGSSAPALTERKRDSSLIV